jgi:membrane-bound lytic murein transglycosylase D
LNARLLPGQVLYIYSLADISGGEFFTYEVHEGDTLYRIARRFKVTVAELRHWNHLDGNDLQPGRRLTLHRAAPLTSSL